MNAVSAQTHVVLCSYVTILVGICEIILFFFDNSKQSDIQFLIIAFIELIGAFLVLSIWQRSRVENRVLKEVQCAIVLGGLIVFMGIFLVEDGFRLGKFSTNHNANSSEHSLKIFSSFLAAVSGLILGSVKYYLGQPLNSSIVVTDGISCVCAGISCAVSFILLLFDSALWAQQLARFTAAAFTIYCGANVIVNENTIMSR